MGTIPPPLYYDIVFDAGTRQECDFIDAMRDRYGRARGTTGTGGGPGAGGCWRRSVRHGYEVVGVDPSEAMVDYASRRLRCCLSVQVIPGRMESFRFRRKFDLAFKLVSTFKYLLSEAQACAVFVAFLTPALHRCSLFEAGSSATGIRFPQSRQSRL